MQSETDVYDSIFKQHPTKAAAFLVSCLKSREYAPEELAMFISEGWEEASHEINVPEFVLGVLIELSVQAAAPILSKSFIRSVLMAPDNALPVNDVMRLVTAHWKAVDPEILVIVHKKCLPPLTPQELTDHAYELWRKGNFKKAVVMSIDFELQEQMEAEFKVIQRLVKVDQTELLLRFIADNPALSKSAITQCTTNKHIKIAGKIIERCNFDPMDFPQVINRMKKSSMRYFLNSQDQGLLELIDLVEDDYECLAIVIEDLEFKCSKKGISWMGEMAAFILRNNPEVADYVRKDVIQSLRKMPVTSRGMPIDQFSPSDSSYLSLPLPLDAVVMIDSDDKVSRIEWTYPVYGLDCEWRPNLIKFETYPVSIMQVASETQVYIIDMLALKNSSILDAKLFELFSSPSIVKVGMAFEGDLKMLRSSLPGFQAFKFPMNSYGDLLAGYKAIKSNSNAGGLAGICQALLGQPLCKAKQRSNWNRRPLRLGQLHYAALDAHCQIKLWEEITRLLNEQGDNSQELLANLGDQKTSSSAPSRGKKCKNCNTFGHAMKKCPKGPRCNVCSEFGHVARACSQFSGS